MESPQSQLYRGIGNQLAAFLQTRSGSFPEPGVLQGVVADLAARDEELILPLKALVSRPGFRALAGLAGSGKGEVQRQALLQELTATFSPQVIAALSELLGGFLDLPEGPTDGATAAAGRPRPAPTEQADVPQATPSRAAPPSPQDVAPEPAAGPEGSSLGVLVLAAMAAALLGLAGMVVLRSPRYCGVVGLCPAPSASTASDKALDAASAAEQELRRANDLEGYRSAVERLERELLKLSGDPLTDMQEQQRRQLQGVASDARQTLRLEEADQERLKRAVAAVDQAEQLSGAEQGEQIAVARQELDGIRPRSFAAAEAGHVRERLTSIAQVNRRTCSFNGRSEACTVNRWGRGTGDVANIVVTWLSDGKQTFYAVSTTGVQIEEDNGRLTSADWRREGGNLIIKSTRGNSTVIPW